MEIIKLILSHINWLAVFVAALANFFLGALWYSKILFAKPWAKEIYGVNDPSEIKAQGNVGFTMAMAFIMTFITALAIGVFVYLPDESIMSKQLLLWGMGCTGLVSLLVAANTYKHYLFESKSFKLVLINVSHDIVGFVLMAVIMIYWR